ncbi:MAG: hypothetical protein Kow0089_18570 [Desulfobulbaceae bacterium]
MRKHLPNILLLLVILVNLFFMAAYIRNNGIGMFFSTTGTVFLVLGILIFIFFLSIDPGYGWLRSMNLTRNYIMIFASMAVSITGVFLIVTGEHLHDLREKKMSRIQRCRDLSAGRVQEVMEQGWYRLEDRQDTAGMTAYLFQKKSDRNRYRVIAVLNSEDDPLERRRLTIRSEMLPAPVVVESAGPACPGILEAEISLDYEQHQKNKEMARFDLGVRILEMDDVGLTGPRPKHLLRLTLHSRGTGPEAVSGGSHSLPSSGLNGKGAGTTKQIGRNGAARFRSTELFSPGSTG